ncbi:type II toxin-antitoxin system RelE/ParE family toxin [Sodalis ligni]|uniref:type II toxin-antitoxin system RelE/ParE family toxin n=1 Tax=Sodalis ligni TaxID=2697027 RepID=UPI00193F337F|nr:type II toxin-antitoxin system RelE/ParE family toxin [Sodalis ligni]QWA10872.1 type II toxin-antitoxin system RelE/ParE family toxin [Sodalis ligni]
MVNVNITETALLCLTDIESFQSDLNGAQSAAELTESLLLDSVAALQEDPKRYRYNSILADFGLKVRERLDPKGYRLLYDENDEDVNILLILHTRQDLVRALYRLQILR